MSISHLRVMYFVRIAISLIAISSSCLSTDPITVIAEGKRSLGMKNNERSVCVATRNRIGSNSKQTHCIQSEIRCRECDRKIFHRDTRTPSFARSLVVELL